jgi:hypothetical protein
MSTIVTSNVSDGTLSIPTTYVTNGSAKAWFSSYTEGTVTNSFNISSGTDNGSGDATYAFTNSFANVNYAAPSGAGWRRSEYHLGLTASSIRYYTVEPNASETALVAYATDGGLTAAYFGDLA